MEGVMARDAEIRMDQKAIDALAKDPELGAAMLDYAAPIVREAQAHAPKLTGAGAKSIRAERAIDKGEQAVHISWDRDHYYMAFHQFGTRFLPARPFLVPPSMEV